MGFLGWKWHQLDHMQTICPSLQTDNHTNTSSLKISAGRMLFRTPNQQRYSTEDKFTDLHKLSQIFTQIKYICRFFSSGTV